MCGRKGHWKAECPDREKEQANTVISMDGMQEQFTEDVNHVVIEELDHEALDQVLPHRVDQHNESYRDNIEDKGKPLEVVCVAFHHPAKRRTHPEKAKWFTTENLARLQTFYQSRLGPIGKKSKISDIHQKQESWTANRLSQNPVNQEPAAPVCMMSSDGITGGMQSKLTLGMAILDTGASRSVVGEDHVPNILEQLPEQIRNMVKEKSSRVGFRFGNNQIEYSFKQLHIPLIHGNQRVWIIIEVVPRATPFLISIHTMKCLRAVIDLESGSCFLKSIGRSIPIIENRNGLMTLKIQDLCRVHRSSKAETSEAHETCAAAFSEFKSCENATRHITSLTDNADTGGNGAIDQGRSRGGNGEPPTPPPGLDEPVRSSQPISGSVSGISSTGEQPGVGSSEPEGTDRPADDVGPGHASHPSTCNPNTRHTNKFRDPPSGTTESSSFGRRESLRTGMGCSGRRRVPRKHVQSTEITSGKELSKPSGGGTKSSFLKNVYGNTSQPQSSSLWGEMVPNQSICQPTNS